MVGISNISNVVMEADADQLDMERKGGGKLRALFPVRMTRILPLGPFTGLRELMASF